MPLSGIFGRHSPRGDSSLSPPFANASTRLPSRPAVIPRPGWDGPTVMNPSPAPVLPRAAKWVFVGGMLTFLVAWQAMFDISDESRAALDAMSDSDIRRYLQDRRQVPPVRHQSLRRLHVNMYSLQPTDSEDGPVGDSGHRPAPRLFGDYLHAAMRQSPRPTPSTQQMAASVTWSPDEERNTVDIEPLVHATGAAELYDVHAQRAVPTPDRRHPLVPAPPGAQVGPGTADNEPRASMEPPELHDRLRCMQLYRPAPNGVKRHRSDPPDLKSLDAAQGFDLCKWTNDWLDVLATWGAKDMFFVYMNGFKVVWVQSETDLSPANVDSRSPAEMLHVRWVAWAEAETSSGRSMLDGASPFTIASTRFADSVYSMGSDRFVFHGVLEQACEVDQQLFAAVRKSCSELVRTSVLDPSGVRGGFAALRFLHNETFRGVRRAHQIAALEADMLKPRPPGLTAPQFHTSLRNKLANYKFVAGHEYRLTQDRLIELVWSLWAPTLNVEALRMQVELLHSKLGKPMSAESVMSDIETWMATQKPASAVVAAQPLKPSPKSDIQALVKQLQQAEQAVLAIQNGPRPQPPRPAPAKAKPAASKATKRVTFNETTMVCLRGCGAKLDANNRCKCEFCACCRRACYQWPASEGGHKLGDCPAKKPGATLPPYKGTKHCPKCQKPGHLPEHCEKGDVGGAFYRHAGAARKPQQAAQPGNASQSSGDAARQQLRKAIVAAQQLEQSAASTSAAEPAAAEAAIGSTVGIEQALKLLAQDSAVFTLTCSFLDSYSSAAVQAAAYAEEMQRPCTADMHSRRQALLAAPCTPPQHAATILECPPTPMLAVSEYIVLDEGVTPSAVRSLNFESEDDTMAGHDTPTLPCASAWDAIDFCASPSAIRFADEVLEVIRAAPRRIMCAAAVVMRTLHDRLVIWAGVRLHVALGGLKRAQQYDMLLTQCIPLHERMPRPARALRDPPSRPDGVSVSRAELRALLAPEPIWPAPRAEGCWSSEGRWQALASTGCTPLRGYRTVTVYGDDIESYGDYTVFTIFDPDTFVRPVIRSHLTCGHSSHDTVFVLSSASELEISAAVSHLLPPVSSDGPLQCGVAATADSPEQHYFNVRIDMARRRYEARTLSLDDAVKLQRFAFRCLEVGEEQALAEAKDNRIRGLPLTCTFCGHGGHSRSTCEHLQTWENLEVYMRRLDDLDEWAAVPQLQLCEVARMDTSMPPSEWCKSVTEHLLPPRERFVSDACQMFMAAATSRRHNAVWQRREVAERDAVVAVHMIQPGAGSSSRSTHPTVQPTALSIQRRRHAVGSALGTTTTSALVPVEATFRARFPRVAAMMAGIRIWRATAPSPPESPPSSPRIVNRQDGGDFCWIEETHRHLWIGDPPLSPTSDSSDDVVAAEIDEVGHATPVESLDTFANSVGIIPARRSASATQVVGGGVKGPQPARSAPMTNEVVRGVKGSADSDSDLSEVSDQVPESADDDTPPQSLRQRRPDGTAMWPHSAEVCKRLVANGVCGHCRQFWQTCIRRGRCAGLGPAASAREDASSTTTVDNEVSARATTTLDLPMVDVEYETYVCETPVPSSPSSAVSSSEPAVPESECDSTTATGHKAEQDEDAFAARCRLRFSCARCGGPHERELCWRPCIECGYPAPEHSLDCILQYDPVRRRISEDAASHTPQYCLYASISDGDIMSWDIGRFVEEDYAWPAHVPMPWRSQPEPVTIAMRRALLGGMLLDDDEISEVATDALEKYTPRFMSIGDMPPSQWLQHTPKHQLKALCRAVSIAEATIHRYTVLGSGGAVMWSAESRPELLAAYTILTKVVYNVTLSTSLHLQCAQSQDAVANQGAIPARRPASVTYTVAGGVKGSWPARSAPTAGDAVRGVKGSADSDVDDEVIGMNEPVSNVYTGAPGVAHQQMKAEAGTLRQSVLTDFFPVEAPTAVSPARTSMRPVKTETSVLCTTTATPDKPSPFIGPQLMTEDEAIDELIARRGTVVDSASELSLQTSHLAFVGPLRQDPGLQVSFAEVGTQSTSNHSGYGKVRYDVPDIDNVPREFTLERVYLIPSFRFNIIAVADWIAIGGSFVHASVDVAMRVANRDLCIKANEPCLITPDGYVLPLLQMVTRNRRLLWMMTVVESTMPLMALAVPRSLPDPEVAHVNVVHVCVTLRNENDNEEYHPPLLFSDSEDDRRSAALTMDDRADLSPQSPGSLAGSPLYAMIVHTPRRRPAPGATPSQSFSTFVGSTSSADSAMSISGGESTAQWCNPRDFGGAWSHAEQMVMSITRAVKDVHIAQPTFASARDMIESVAALDRDGSRNEGMTPPPQEAVAVLPLQSVCTRCGGLHGQSECRQPCQQCLFVWPHHEPSCDMRHETSQTRLVAADQVPSGLGDITTDLEGGQTFNLTREQIIATSVTSDWIDQVSDEHIRSKYTPVLMQRYAPTMIQCCGADAELWIRWLDDEQQATLCRAVARVEEAVSSFAVRTGHETQGTTILWTPGTRQALQRAHAQLHRVTADLATDLAAIMEQACTSE